MPRQKSVRTIVVEVMMYVGMAAVVGQIAANFWERFMIQAELVNMKSSLHSLKFAVNNIGAAYDNLYQEIKHLVTETERKALPPSPVQYKHSSNPYKHKPPEKIEVLPAIVQPASLDVGTAFERSVRDFMQACKLPVGKNVSTLTRYPLKSTAVGKEEELNPTSMCYRVRRCYNHDDNNGRFKPLHNL